MVYFYFPKATIKLMVHFTHELKSHCKIVFWVTRVGRIDLQETGDTGFSILEIG